MLSLPAQRAQPDELLCLAGLQISRCAWLGCAAHATTTHTSHRARHQRAAPLPMVLCTETVANIAASKCAWYKHHANLARSALTCTATSGAEERPPRSPSTHIQLHPVHPWRQRRPRSGSATTRPSTSETISLTPCAASAASSSSTTRSRAGCGSRRSRTLVPPTPPQRQVLRVSSRKASMRPVAAL
jgi:hypothetical protein